MGEPGLVVCAWCVAFGRAGAVWELWDLCLIYGDFWGRNQEKETWIGALEGCLKCPNLGGF